MYIDEFNAAYERTINHGLQVPALIKYQGDTLLTPYLKSQLPNIMLFIIGSSFVEKLDRRCLNIHFQMQPWLEKALQTKVYYTIGSIYESGQPLCELTSEKISELLKQQRSPSTLKIHAWLTLPTMEIVDFTTLTSRAVKQSQTRELGAVNALHPDKDVSEFKYTPMLIGDDFLHEIRVAL